MRMTSCGFHQAACDEAQGATRRRKDAAEDVVAHQAVEFRRRRVGDAGKLAGVAGLLAVWREFGLPHGSGGTSGP